MSKSPSIIAQVETQFRLLLAAKKPVAVEEAARAVDIPEDFDKRALGGFIHSMVKAGEIVEFGFRQSATVRSNKAIKRLWIATDKLQAKPRKDRHHG